MEQQRIRPFAALIVGGLLLVGNEYAAEHYRTFHASAYVLGIGCLLAGAVAACSCGPRDPTTQA